MGLGPVEASRQAVARAGLGIGDVDLVEMNEAFAAQVLPSVDQLGLDLDRVNVNGGAIALGHPFGSTGARMITTLIHGLAERAGPRDVVHGEVLRGQVPLQPGLFPHQAGAVAPAQRRGESIRPGGQRRHLAKIVLRRHGQPLPLGWPVGPHPTST